MNLFENSFIWSLIDPAVEFVKKTDWGKQQFELHWLGGKLCAGLVFSYLVLSQIVQDYTLHMACHMNDPLMMINDNSDIVVYH